MTWTALSRPAMTWPAMTRAAVAQSALAQSILAQAAMARAARAALAQTPPALSRRVVTQAAIGGAGTTRPAADRGFGLVEALVALAVLALVAVTYIGATEAHLVRIRGLEQRTVARWVAQNLLAEWSARGGPPPTEAVSVRLLDQDWAARALLSATDDPDLARIEITVAVADRVAAGGAGRDVRGGAGDGDLAPVVRLQGFLDLGGAR